MVQVGRFAVVAAVAMMLAMVNPSAVAASSTMGGGAPIQPWLVEHMERTGPTQSLTVLVHGVDLESARAAVARSGLTRLRDLTRIGVTIAKGTAEEIRLAALQRGVTYVEGNQPIEFHLGSSHEATRSDEASTSLARDGRALDGVGVSVAVIDTGVDPTHPFFAAAEGESVVVANLKNVCGVISSESETCFAGVGPQVDTDTTALGGHGTHVNGIVAGQPVTLADEGELRGAAPGARIVSLSMGAGLVIINAHLALEWVLEHHAAPCGTDVPPESCPPIKAVNNSYGPQGGGEFNPNDAAVKLQRALADEGVVTVWSNGNGGGDGSSNMSNPPGQDPTPGIISVASYFDENSGTRDGVVSDYSSRGDRKRPQTWPDVSAPGESITSACRPYLVICSTGLDPQNGAGPTDIGAYNTISGTSMAAPHIAGIVAQLFQADPAASPAEVEHALKSTAHRYTDGSAYDTVDGYSSSFDKGTGLVDVAAAIPALPRWTSSAEDQPALAADSVEDGVSPPPARSAPPPRQLERAGAQTSAPSSSSSVQNHGTTSAAVPVIRSKATDVDVVNAATPLVDGGFGIGPLLWISALVALLSATALYLLGGRRASS